MSKTAAEIIGRGGFFHTNTVFEKYGLEILQHHCRNYLAGNDSIPVCRTGKFIDPTSGEEQYLTFTYSNDLLKKIVRQPGIMKKPHQAALKYGFRGFSKGGKNGIFFVRKQDKELNSAIESLIEKYITEIEEDLEVQLQQFDSLRPVKIVCHEPSGSRVIGVMANKAWKTRGDSGLTIHSRAIFLGISRY